MASMQNGQLGTSLLEHQFPQGIDRSLILGYLEHVLWHRQGGWEAKEEIVEVIKRILARAKASEEGPMARPKHACSGDCSKNHLKSPKAQEVPDYVFVEAESSNSKGKGKAKIHSPTLSPPSAMENIPERAAWIVETDVASTSAESLGSMSSTGWTAGTSPESPPKISAKEVASHEQYSFSPERREELTRQMNADINRYSRQRERVFRSMGNVCATQKLYLNPKDVRQLHHSKNPHRAPARDQSRNVTDDFLAYLVTEVAHSQVVLPENDDRFELQDSLPEHRFRHSLINPSQDWQDNPYESRAEPDSYLREKLSVFEGATILADMMRALDDGMDVREAHAIVFLWTQFWLRSTSQDCYFSMTYRAVPLAAMIFWVALRHGFGAWRPSDNMIKVLEACCRDTQASDTK
ncbi:hypothetical protein DL98DRAFT_657133 [Cadophora sp. DSE1049]|nr:hypothetical protein DL98DRAFT_657133 [Cadophora sp. DSE1049]